MDKQIINYDHEADVFAVYIKKGKEESFKEVAPNRVLRSILKSAKKYLPAHAR